MQLASDPCHVWCHVALQSCGHQKGKRVATQGMGQSQWGTEDMKKTPSILMGMLDERLFLFGHVCCLERSVTNFVCESQRNACGCLAGERIFLIKPPKLPLHSLSPSSKQSSLSISLTKDSTPPPFMLIKHQQRGRAPGQQNEKALLRPASQGNDHLSRALPWK